MESAPLVTLLSPPTSRRSGLPAHSKKAFASGPAPYRAVLLGAGSMTGEHHVMLADLVAHDVAARTGHGVEVDAVDAQPLTEAEEDMVLAGRDLSRIDALIVVLDPRRDSTATRAAIRRLTENVSERLTVGAALVVVVPPDRGTTLTADDADRLVVAARETVGTLTPVVRLETRSDAGPEEEVARWGAIVGEVTAKALIEPLVHVMPDDPFDEFRRVEAVARVGRRYAEWVDAFQDVVDAARTMYDTPSAAMSIIDDETTRYFTRTGNVAVSLPRGKTVCNRVMRIYGGLILGDARLDQRFNGLPEVRTGDVRFYAGYRITLPGGAPFGALCVFDSKPRVVEDDDLTALRDLALEAQRRVGSLVGGDPAA